MPRLPWWVCLAIAAFVVGWFLGCASGYAKALADRTGFIREFVAKMKGLGNTRGQR